MNLARKMRALVFFVVFFLVNVVLLCYAACCCCFQAMVLVVDIVDFAIFLAICFFNYHICFSRYPSFLCYTFYFL